jgi:hypothetical protein
MLVSKSPDWVVICDPERSSLLDADRFCVPSRDVRLSPIDDFTAYLRMVIPLGEPKALDGNEVLGRVLLLGIVSGTEKYFRSLLSELIFACPISRQAASDQMLSLQALDYYGTRQIGLGLLENTSFAGSGEILKATKKLTGIDWKEHDSVHEAISAFEALSHLRHAAIHARGDLGPRNAKALKINPKERQCLVVKFAELQQAADICLNSVRAYNRFMYQKVVERWIGHKVLTGNWKKDRSHFGRLLELFGSKENGCAGGRFAVYAYEKVKPAIRASLKPKP